MMTVGYLTLCLKADNGEIIVRRSNFIFVNVTKLTFVSNEFLASLIFLMFTMAKNCL
jgi:hypothetical protein